MDEIKKKVAKDYIENPWVCPFCGSKDTHGSGDLKVEKQLMTNRKYVVNDVVCESCDKQWVEYYTMKYVWSEV